MGDYRAIRSFLLRIREGDSDHEREINFPAGVLKGIPPEIANHWFFDQNTEPLDHEEKAKKQRRLEAKAKENLGVTTWPESPTHSDLSDPLTRDPRDTRRTGEFVPAGTHVTSTNFGGVERPVFASVDPLGPAGTANNMDPSSVVQRQQPVPAGTNEDLSVQRHEFGDVTIDKANQSTDARREMNANLDAANKEAVAQAEAQKTEAQAEAQKAEAAKSSNK